VGYRFTVRVNRDMLFESPHEPLADNITCTRPASCLWELTAEHVFPLWPRLWESLRRLSRRSAPEGLPRRKSAQRSFLRRRGCDSRFEGLAGVANGRWFTEPDHADHTPQAGREFSLMTIPELARRWLSEQGLSTFGSHADIVQRALSGLHTTSDFASAFWRDVQSGSADTASTTESGVGNLQASIGCRF
jgi:hypothetical protein